MAIDVKHDKAPHDGICPYCGHNSFWNSWGEGNASCESCEQEFILHIECGKVWGEPLPYKPEEK